MASDHLMAESLVRPGVTAIERAAVQREGAPGLRRTDACNLSSRLNVENVLTVCSSLTTSRACPAISPVSPVGRRFQSSSAMASSTPSCGSPLLRSRRTSTRWCADRSGPHDGGGLVPSASSTSSAATDAVTRLAGPFRFSDCDGSARRAAVRPVTNANIVVRIPNACRTAGLGPAPYEGTRGW